MIGLGYSVGELVDDRVRRESRQEWHDVTTIEGDWEVEMDINADAGSEWAWRHRRPAIRGFSTDWVPGRPPTGVYAKKAESDGQSR